MHAQYRLADNYIQNVDIICKNYSAFKLQILKTLY